MSIGRVALLIALSFTAMVPSGRAAPASDQDAGTWTDLYEDAAGIDFGASIDVAHSAGRVTLSTGATSGTLVTTPITPASSAGWGKVYLDAQAQSPSDLQVRARVGATTYGPFPLTQTNLAGFTLEATLTGVPTTADLQLVVTLSRSASIAPSLSAARVTWTARPVVGIALETPNTPCSGATLNVRARLSVSYVDVARLIVWVPLPAPSAGPRPQDAALRFHAASAGGIYRSAAAGPITVSGHTIPAHSVYWDLGPRKAGSTFVVSFDVSSPSGTLDDTAYPFVAWAGLEVGGQAESVTTSATVSIQAAPAPIISKRATGVFPILGLDRAPVGANVGYVVSVTNPAGLCAETMHDVVVLDDVSELLAHPDLNGPVLAEVSPPFSSGISPGGTYYASATTLSGVAIPADTIAWSLGTLPVGTTRTVTFVAGLDDALPDGLLVSNCARVASGFRTVDAESCHLLEVGIPSEPSVGFMKGDTIRGSLSVTASEDNASLAASYGEVVGFTLVARNGGASVLDSARSFDRIPDGVSLLAAWVPPGSATTILYNTEDTGSPTTPPDLGPDGDVVVGPGAWSSTLPANPADVRWVVALEPALASEWFPVDDIPTESRLDLLVRIDDPLDACAATTITNTALFRALGYTPLGGSSVLLDPPLQSTAVERIAVQPPLPYPGLHPIVATPTTVVGLSETTWDVRFTNLQPGGVPTGTATTATLRLELPRTAINGVDAPLPFVGVTAPGATIDYSDLPDTLTLTWRDVPAQASRSARLTTRVPRGVLDLATPRLYTSLTTTDATCPATSAATSATVTVRVEPELRVSKAVDFSVASPGSLVEYTLTLVDVGDGAARGVVVLDRIPEGASFHSAAPLEGGEVWFANAEAPALPLSVAPDNTIDEVFIRTSGLFVPGTLSNGRIVSPLPAPTWVAFLADDQRLTPPQVAASTARVMSFRATLAGDNGAVTTNRALANANGLLAAVGNTVTTVLAESPSLAVTRACPEVVRAGETFTYTIAYRNDSANPDTSVTLTDTLPPTVTFAGSTHAWNALSQPVYGSTNVPATSTPPTVTWDVTTATSTPLLPQEGGTITASVTVSPATPSGTFIHLAGTGTAVNSGGTFAVPTSCIVRVENPDVWTTIDVDQNAPIAGDRQTYLVRFGNARFIAADEAVFTITLPPELVFDPSTVSIPTANALIGPVVTTNAQGTTLRFSQEDLNGVGPITMSAGRELMVSFEATVGAVSGGDTFTACSAITTVTVQDDVLADTDCTPSLVPLPDPYIEKVGPAVARPEDAVSWTLRYGNTSRQAHGPIAFVDSLPDGPNPPANGEVDVTFQAAYGARGEAIWLHDESPAPVIDPLDPAASGWTRNASDLSGPVAQVAIVLPGLAGEAGPFEVTLTAALVDPVTGTPSPAGARHENCVSTQADEDGDPSNNTSCTTVAVPGLDVAILLSCEPEGRVPGTRPGDEVAHGVVVQNAGTTPAYGVHTTVALPALVTETSCDAGLVTVPLVDAAGLPLTRPVTWTREGQTFYLGSRDPSSPVHYRKVGLPPGGSATFRFTGLVDRATAHDTALDASATVTSDRRDDLDPVETITSNNLDACGTIALRPDLTLDKSVALAGSTPMSVAPGDTLEYTLTFDNVGLAAADDGLLEDYLPDGVGYVVGSVAGLPEGATLELFDGTSWGYVASTPEGHVDPNVRGLRIRFGEPIASPPGGAFEARLPADFARGTFDGTRAFGVGVELDMTQDNNSGTISWRSPLIPAEGSATTWGLGKLQVRDAAPDEDIVLSVVDVEGNPIPGFGDLERDAQGVFDLSGLDPVAYRQVRLVATWRSSKVPECGRWEVSPVTPSSLGGVNPIWSRDALAAFGDDSAWTPSNLTRSGLLRTRMPVPAGMVGALGPSRPSHDGTVVSGSYYNPQGQVVGGTAVWSRGPTGWTFEAAPHVGSFGTPIRTAHSSRLIAATESTTARLLVPPGPHAPTWSLVPWTSIGSDNNRVQQFGDFLVVHSTQGGTQTARVDPTSLTGVTTLNLQSPVGGGFNINSTVVMGYQGVGNRLLALKSPGGATARVMAVHERVGETWTTFNLDVSGVVTAALSRMTLLDDGTVLGKATFSSTLGLYAWVRTSTGYARSLVTTMTASDEYTAGQDGTVVTRGQLFARSGNTYVARTAAELGFPGATVTALAVDVVGDTAAVSVDGVGHIITLDASDLAVTSVPVDTTGVTESALPGVFRASDAVVARSTAGVWTRFPGVATARATTVVGLAPPTFGYYPARSGQALLAGQAPWGCPGTSTLALDNLQLGYRADVRPSLTYRVVVDDTCLATFTNSAAIGTSTPEIALDNNGAEVSVPLETANVAVNLEVDRAAVLPGDTVHFTLTVRNDGPAIARDVEVRLDAPPLLTGFVQTLPELVPGLPVVIETSAVAGALLPGETLNATATVTTSTKDCGLTDDADTLTLFSGSLPNPWVTLSGPTRGVSDEPAILTVTTGNNGNAPADADLTVVVPAGLTVTAAPGATITVLPSGATQLDYGTSTATPGVETTALITVTGSACTNTSGTFEADLDVAVEQVTSADDYDAHELALVSQPATLEVFAFAHRATAEPGDLLAYTLFVRNPGAMPARSVHLAIPLPEGAIADVTTVPGATLTGGVIHLELGDLPPLMTTSIALALRLEDDASGSLTPTFTVTSDTSCQPATTSATTQITGPGLHLVKSPDLGTTCLGLDPQITWTLIATHTGTTPLTATLEDTLPSDPPGLSYIAGSIFGPGASDIDAPTLRWNLGTLAPGNAVTLGYRTTTPTSTGLSNLYQNQAGGAATAFAPVLGDCEAPLSIALSADASCATPGSAFSGSLVIENRADRPLSAVVADLILPPTVLSATAPDGVLVTGLSGSRLTVTLGAMATGERRVIPFSATFAADLDSGTLVTLSAQVAAADVPPVAANTWDTALLVCTGAGPCVDVACAPLIGCDVSVAPDGQGCQGGGDGNACTVNDVCEGGVCVPGAPLTCDDGNECTSDACDPGTGCVYTFRPGPCGDDLCGGAECVENEPGTAPTCEVIEVPTCDVAAGEPLAVYGVVTDTAGTPVGSVRCELVEGTSLTCVTDPQDPNKVLVFDQLWCAP